MDNFLKSDSSVLWLSLRQKLAKYFYKQGSFVTRFVIRILSTTSTAAELTSHAGEL